MPQHAEGRLYAIDSRSVVRCLEAETRTVTWTTSIDSEFVAHAAHTRHAPAIYQCRLVVGNAGAQP